MLVRVSRYSEKAFRTSRHPQAAALAKADTNTARLKDISEVPVTDHWHRQLSKALRFSVQMIESGALR